jgi:hypothetical protein
VTVNPICRDWGAVGREGFFNDIVKVRWLLVNALIDAWYQVITLNLCRTGAELSGLFPFSIQRVLESTNFIEDEIVSQFPRLQIAQDLLNINVQVITESDKIQETAEPLRGNHVEPLVVFEESLDY